MVVVSVIFKTGNIFLFCRQGDMHTDTMKLFGKGWKRTGGACLVLKVNSCPILSFVSKILRLATSSDLAQVCQK